MLAEGSSYPGGVGCVSVNRGFNFTGLLTSVPYVLLWQRFITLAVNVAISKHTCKLSTVKCKRFVLQSTLIQCVQCTCMYIYIYTCTCTCMSTVIVL